MLQGGSILVAAATAALAVHPRCSRPVPALKYTPCFPVCDTRSHRDDVFCANIQLHFGNSACKRHDAVLILRRIIEPRHTMLLSHSILIRREKPDSPGR